MVDNTDADSMDFRTIIMIIDTLEEHEQKLDKSINNLALMMKQIDGFIVVKDRIIQVEKKLNVLQEDIKRLATLLSSN